MIYAVAGGKGGVGKSTLSLELGAALDATVVDGDLAMADLPTGRGPDLHDVLAGVAEPREAIRTLGAIRVVPCGRTLAGVRAGDPAALGEVLKTLAADRPVVVDCPAGMAADAGVAMATADRSVLVTTPDAPAQVDALRTRELSRVLGTGVGALVVNRVETPSVVEEARRRFGLPTVGVPDSRALARTMDGGKPLVHRRPDGSATQAIREVTAAIRRSVSA